MAEAAGEIKDEDEDAVEDAGTTEEEEVGAEKPHPSSSQNRQDGTAIVEEELQPQHYHNYPTRLWV